MRHRAIVRQVNVQPVLLQVPRHQLAQRDDAVLLGQVLDAKVLYMYQGWFVSTRASQGFLTDDG